MKLGGMIQYGRADLDLAAYDVKYFGMQLDSVHFIVQKSENNFPARAIKYASRWAFTSDAFPPLSNLHTHRVHRAFIP